MVSWFILPWEAARVSMEAQRIIAAQFFGFVFPRAQDQTHQAEEQTHKERTSDREKALVNGQDPVRKRVIAARNNAHVIKRTSGTRKRKGSARKRAR
jgi:hypothetical protein